MALAGWDSTKKYSWTVAAGDVPTDEVDFPALLNISAASGLSALDLSAIFTELGANSLKIAVEDGNTGNQCYVEVERWDDANLSAQLWVKIPAVSSTVDTVINFYYDAAQADNTTYVGATTTVPAQNVWNAGFVAVYHMSQDPSGTAPQILDSTSNANHGTTYGTMTSTDLVAGLVGDAIQFDGTDDYVDVGADASLGVTGAVGLTLEASLNAPSVANRDFIARDDNVARGYVFRLNALSLNLEVGGAIQGTATNPIIANTWTNCAVTQYAGSYTFYTDGATNGTNTCTDIPDNSAEPTSLARRNYPGYEEYYSGILDEIRLSNVTRSSGWLAITNLSNRDQLGTWLFAGAATISLRNDIVQTYPLAPILHSILNQLYNLTLILNNALSQIYSLRTATSFVQVYSLTLDLLQTFEQSYGLRLVTFLKEYYGDSPVITATLNEYYGDSATPRKSLTQAYGDALVQNSALKQDYSLLHALTNFVEQEYVLAELLITSSLTAKYSIKDVTELRNSLGSFYSLVAGSASIFQPVISVMSGTTVVDFLSVSISSSKSQYCLSADINLASVKDYQVCQHLAEIVITINSVDFQFFVDKRSRSVDNTAARYSISLLSPTAKLDSPYSKTIVDTLPDGANAHDLIVSMAAKQGITVDYQLIDWNIPSNAISINDETPLAVIKKIARAAGGIVQTKPDGSLLISSAYPVRVPDWTTTIPAVSFDVADNVKKIGEELDVRDGFNAFVLTDQGSSSKSITLEQHVIDADTKEIRGFRVPFSDGSFSLATSGGAAVSIESFSAYQETTLPEVVNADDPEWEVVEFIDWKGSVSHPIYSIVAWEWIKDDLGAFQISESGALTIINQAAVPGESLLRIKYKTRYWRWLIHGPVNIPIQFYVPEITS